jgi:AcrR family transcriptional regulator
MTDVEKTGRSNQRRRTRKDLLEAAAHLMRQGVSASLEEVAEEALVSRATAYRYFPSIEALLMEAALDVAIPSADDLFGEGASDDPLTRVEAVDTALHEMILANEAPLRMMLINALERSIRGETDGALPARQNRRTPLIEAALAPAGEGYDPAALDTLGKALALIVGAEAMVVCKDVLQLDDAETRAVKRWAIRALVEAAKKPATF